MVALSEWNFKSQLGQKRSTHDKSKIEDEKLLKQVCYGNRNVKKNYCTPLHAQQSQGVQFIAPNPFSSLEGVIIQAFLL